MESKKRTQEVSMSKTNPTETKIGCVPAQRWILRIVGSVVSLSDQLVAVLAGFVSHFALQRSHGEKHSLPSSLRFPPHQPSLYGASWTNFDIR